MHYYWYVCRTKGKLTQFRGGIPVHWLKKNGPFVVARIVTLLHYVVPSGQGLGGGEGLVDRCAAIGNDHPLALVRDP